MVPAMLQIPIYITWWYNRNQIDLMDKERMQIDGLPPWHNPLLKYSNDIIIIVTPFVLVGLAAYILKNKKIPVDGNSDLKILLYVSTVSTLVSIVIMGLFGMRRYRRMKK